MGALVFRLLRIVQYIPVDCLAPYEVFYMSLQNVCE
jgi:hypothetical protein